MARRSHFVSAMTLSTNTAARSANVRAASMEPCREQPLVKTPVFLQPPPSMTDILMRKPIARNDVQQELQTRAANAQSPDATKKTTRPVTADELQKISPGLPRAQAELMAPKVSAAMEQAGITDKRERAAFLAQTAHETDGFRTMEEYASGKDYEGRKNLGNTQKGDGERFKGRGLVQLTGRDNYEKAGAAIGVDLANQPELAAQSPYAEQIAAWYWKQNGIGELAREGKFEKVTRGINGGTNGKESRRDYYDRALKLNA